MTTDSLPKDATGSPKTLDWRLLLPVFVIVSMYAAGMAAVMPVLPFYIREMGGSPLVLGIVVATEAFSQFSSAPVLGQLSDRFGRKRILLASQFAAAVSLLLLASAPNIFFILLARALFGMTAGNLSAAAAYVADHSDAKSRRQSIGILTGGVGLGGIVGAGLSGLLSDTSLTAPIYAALVLTLLTVAVTFFRLEDGQATPRLEGQANGEKRSFRAILGAPVLRILVIVMVCHFFAYGMYTSQMPVFLADTFIWNGHAFGPKELSYIMMADGVINVLVQLFLLGWLGKYFTERNLIILIFALVCAGFLTAGLANTLPVLAFAVLCVSTGDALAKPTYLAALSVQVPPERQGVVMGAAQALIAVTDILSPVLGGFILGYALYGVWIGVAMAVALAGVAVTIARLPKSDPELIAKPEAP
ncbi:MFS transporter [Myxococcus sp. AB056]|uniref:MFS transporter n=1 Tax=Myxococcus sp. AB056 TaxID=2562792 RepID=UPI001146F9F5|nr:MFS transporter [Myxococcus sp. AB056]